MQQLRRLTLVALALLPLSVAGIRAQSAATPGVANPGLWNTLKPSQRAAITRNGFAVGPFRQYNDQQFFDLYKSTLSQGIPSFITTDALLHMFHIVYDKTLVAMERELLAPKLEHLSAELMSTTSYQYGATGDAHVREAARLNLGYVTVARRLLDPQAAVPALVASQVRGELVLIQAHRGFARSPLFGTQMDYSQFVPRGHYNLTPALRRYFQAMIWYGRTPFLLNGPDGPARTREALLLVRAVTMVSSLSQLWSAIFDPATAWVGHSDDLTVRDYARVMAQVYGANAPLSALADPAKLARFIALANALPNLQITGDVVASSSGAARATRGMRFFPQRFIPDAAIMQALIWDKVGTVQNKRLWPMGLDVAASLGSARAASLLIGQLHQDRYARFTEQLTKVRQRYTTLPASAWSQNLYWRWLDVLRAVWELAPATAPSFMKNTAWTDKSLAAGLGSWAELRHDSLLYAKQPYGLGAGFGPSPFRAPYVEPVPRVWERLLALARAFRATLTREGLLDQFAQNPIRLTPSMARVGLYPAPPGGEAGYRAAIDSFIALVALLQRTAEGELQGRVLSRADATTLQKIGLELEALDGFFQNNGAGKLLLPEQQQVAVIADIFTEPGSGQVLEEGVGDVLPVYAIVSINGRRWLAEGGVFSYYEFHQPMSNRLTDEAWRSMKHQPTQPAWTAGYITSG